MNELARKSGPMVHGLWHGFRERFKEDVEGGTKSLAGAQPFLATELKKLSTHLKGLSLDSEFAQDQW